MIRHGAVYGVTHFDITGISEDAIRTIEATDISYFKLTVITIEKKITN